MNDLDILEYNGAGYMPLHDFNGWRVAFLRCDDEYKKIKILYKYNCFNIKCNFFNVVKI